MTEHDHATHFVVPIKYYLGTFGALLCLTFITVFVAQFDFGTWNIVVAMGVAIVKASLVLAFFMGLRWDKGFYFIAFISAILFMIIFFAFTLSDTLTRGGVDPIEAGVHGLNTPVKPVSDHHGEGEHH